MAINSKPQASDYNEAARLARHWMRLPVGTVLLGLVLLSGVASAASTVLATVR
jgi:hypothetical protein